MTEELVAMQVEREPLEEPADVEDPIAPPLEHFHAVVETLNKPIRLPTLEVCVNPYPSTDRSSQESPRTPQAHLPAPACTRLESHTWPLPSCSRVQQFCQVFP